MSLEVELDMRVDPDSEVTMSVEDGDEVSFGVAEAIVVKDHAILDNRDLPDQHPISAITGLAEALAESGKIDTVKVNGTALPVVNKAVDVPVPTTTSQLTNNSGFITSADVPTKTSELQNDSGYLTSAVTSFNGSTGAVTYSAPVSSVNSKTGAVTLNASDVGALPSSTTIPTKTSDLNNDSGFITGINSTDVTTALGYTPYNGATNPNGYITASQVPVTSVNGRTGAVTGLAEASSLATVATTGDYDDLIDKPTIPTNVSAFTNDAGYLVANDLTEATDADVIAIVV